MKFVITLKKIRGKLFPIHMSQPNSRPDNDRRPFALFVLIILFYAIYLLTMQPDWVTGGEMWSEMATNYYPNANASSFFQRILSTDAGYIPVPQRLIALTGTFLKLPAASIPYYYTWSSILYTGMLVGTFCLTPFRKIVKSDFLRFFTSIAILLIVDFETRTFINFTYFVAFFVTIVTALALVDDTDEVPWWAMFIPVLMISKPAVLAVLPAMLLTFFVSRSRFRWIVLFTVPLCIGQVLRIIISSSAGVMQNTYAYSPLSSKLKAILIYFLSILGGYISGHSSHHLRLFYLMLIGTLFLFLCIGLVIYKRSSSNALILVGFSLLFSNIVLNIFALSSLWNIHTAKAHFLTIDRHIIPAFFGCALVVCGMISSISSNNISISRSSFLRGAGAFIFVMWFLGVGWVKYAGKLNREPVGPTLHSSQWQNMASAIDAGVSPLCVPTNPWWYGLNWMYHRNCDLLHSPPVWETGSILVDDHVAYQITLPKEIVGKTLVSAAILFKPLRPGKSFVEVSMRIALKDGSVRYFLGSNNFDGFGGLLMLVGEKPVSLNEVEDITLRFNVPAEVALAAQQPANMPGVAWMGH